MFCCIACKMFFSNSPLKCCLWPQRHYCITIVVVFAFMKTVGSRVLGLGSNYSLHIYPNRNLPSALRHMKVTLYHVLPRKLKNIFQMQENNLSSYSSVDSSEPCILWPQVWIPNTYFSGSKIEQFFNWLFTCVKITSSWKVTCYYHNHERNIGNQMAWASLGNVYNIDHMGAEFWWKHEIDALDTKSIWATYNDEAFFSPQTGAKSIEWGRCHTKATTRYFKVAILRHV